MVLRVRRPGLTRMERDVQGGYRQHATRHLAMLRLQYYAQPIGVITQVLCEDMRMVVGGWVSQPEARAAAQVIHDGAAVSVEVIDGTRPPTFPELAGVATRLSTPRR